MKLYKNQKGFSLVEGLLVIIALAIVGGVGYYVYHTQQETSKTVDTAKTTNQSTATASTEAKDYLVLKEVGMKMDKTGMPGVYYKVGKNQTPINDIPGFSEVMTFELYDKTYDSTTNNSGLPCDGVSPNSPLAKLEIVPESVRDSKYSQYKNKERGFEDIWPASLSDKYATKKDGYLYVYGNLEGVQALPGCAEDANDQRVLDQLAKSRAGFKQMIGTLVKQ